MDNSTIVSLAGITGTLISSGLGLYFVAQSRRNSMRDKLFDRQLNLISKIVHKQGRIKLYCSILRGDNKKFRERARGDLSEAVRDLSEMENEGAALLPTQLW